jgi:hypothetical protein
MHPRRRHSQSALENPKKWQRTRGISTEEREIANQKKMRRNLRIHRLLDPSGTCMAHTCGVYCSNRCGVLTFDGPDELTIFDQNISRY